MRLCIIAPMFPPLKTGSSHYAYRIANGFAERGHDVFVITLRNATKQDSSSFKIIRIPSLMVPSTPLTHNFSLPFFFSPLNYPLLKNIISDKQPDVIHINGQFLDLNLMGVMAAQSLKIPSVATIHTRLVHANQTLNGFFRAVDKAIIKKLISNVDSIIALDRQMYRYIENTYQVSQDKIATIPLGLDVEELVKMHEISTIKDTHDSRRIIASLTHVTALKTPRTLLYAFAKLKKTYQDLKLVLIGSIKDPRVRIWIDELNLKDDVELLGPIKHYQIPSILKQCIIEAHSLDFRTGFDNASIEAMALGLPVVSCVREDNFIKPWLKNWENVVLIEPRNVDMATDALKQLLENENLYHSISNKAKLSAQKYFSLDRMLDDLEILYNKII